MKKVIFTLLLAVVALRAISQEQATYTHYPIFPILINPGYTGFENQHQFLGNYRSNWSGFPGAPKSYTVMYHGPVGDKLGLGGGVFSEKAGDLNLFRIQGNEHHAMFRSVFGKILRKFHQCTSARGIVVGTVIN